jgi:hypothetical protein
LGWFLVSAITIALARGRAFLLETSRKTVGILEQVMVRR